MSEKWVDVTSESVPVMQFDCGGDAKVLIKHNGAVIHKLSNPARIPTHRLKTVPASSAAGYRFVYRSADTFRIEKRIDVPDTVTVIIEGHNIEISRASAIALGLLKE